jgi:hypothetical protein
MKTLKYLIKTSEDRTYSLYIMETEEFTKGKYIALFLYYDDNEGFNSPEKLWLRLKHRILYENTVDAIKDKVSEYGNGRNESFVFLEMG